MGRMSRAAAGHLEVCGMEEDPGVSSKWREEGREVFFQSPKRFLRGKFICHPDMYASQTWGFCCVAGGARGVFFSVLDSTQLVAAEKIYGQLAGPSPKVLSLASPVSRAGGPQALVSQPSFKPPVLERIAAMGCRRGAELRLGWAVRSPSATCSPFWGSVSSKLPRS